jgi:hypothetical protein
VDSVTNNGSKNNGSDNNLQDVASETVLAVYQFASPVPHVLHYTADDDNDNNNSDSDDTLIEAVLNSLVPANGAHKSHLVAAARSLMDYEPSVSGSAGGT